MLQERTDSLTAVRAESLATKSSLQATAETAAKQASTYKEQLVAANERLQVEAVSGQSVVSQWSVSGQSVGSQWSVSGQS